MSKSLEDISSNKPIMRIASLISWEIDTYLALMPDCAMIVCNFIFHDNMESRNLSGIFARLHRSGHTDTQCKLCPGVCSSPGS